MRAAARIGIALFVLAVAGCGARQSAGELSAIERLRKRAAENPTDPAIQRELAEAELLAPGGDVKRAKKQIERALSLAPEDEALLWLSSIERNMHGDLEASLDRALAAVEHARAADGPEAPLIAELAIGIVSDLVDSVRGYGDRVREELEPVVRKPRGAGPAAQALAGGVLIELAYRRGDRAAVETLADALGCVKSWRVAGPFGPRDLLGFDRRHAALADGPLAEQYDLGPQRGVQPTRELGAEGCTVRLGARSEVSEGGATYAEAFVEVSEDEAGEHVLRLETPNPVEVYLDGERAVRLDARHRPVPRVTYHRMDLQAGRHEVTVKVATRHTNPVLDVALLPTPMVDPPDASSVFRRYLRAGVEYSRGDVVAARERLRRVRASGEGSPVVLLLASSVALSDPLRPGDVRRDEARQLLGAAAKRDPNAWLPQLQLARLAAADGQTVLAIERLRKAVERWPGVLALRLTLQNLLLDRGWEAEAYEVTQDALELVPDACPAIRVALGAARRRDDIPRTRALIDRLVACDARSDARFDDLVARRRWQAALDELDRLTEIDPPQAHTRVLRRQIRIARGRGDDARIAKLLHRLAEQRSRQSSYRRQIADRLHAEGRTDRALAVLDDAIASDPEAMAGLRWARHVLGGDNEIDRWRVDGADVLEQFEASGREYDAPQLLVWDYMVVRVLPDGSSFKIIHQIYKVQSEEAVNEHGEFSEPSGARLLELQTIKADGTRIEPDHIAGKDTISLPDLAPGDYVEHEFVKFESPPSGMPGAVLGDRFLFRNFETPFDRSEYKVIVPEDMELTLDPRGPAPETHEHVEDGLRVYDWKVTESRPLVREPMSVSPREWVPSISWGVNAEWELFVGGLLDVLVDKDVADPAARRLALEVLGDARDADDVTKARRLYHWVLENVEDTDSVFGQAAPMLAQRTGDRHRVLRYLLGLVGVESDLVLSRTIAGDQTKPAVANDGTYTNLLLLLEPEGYPPIFLSLGQRGAPFGHVPPMVRGQEALVVGPEARRVTLPEGEPGQDRHTVELRVRLAPNGSAEVRAEEVFRGAAAVAWRNNLEGVPDAVLEDRLDEHYVARLIPGARLVDLKLEGRNAPEKPFVMRYAFEVPVLGRRQGGRWVVPPLLPPRLASRYAKIAERTTTQVVAPPIDRDFTLRLELPEGTKASSFGRPVLLEGPGRARFAMRAERKGNALVIERKARVPLMRVRPEAYPRWVTFCRKVDAAAEREIRLRFPR